MMRARILPLLFLFVFQVTAGCTKEPERAKTQYPGYATDNATAESDNTSIPTDNSATAIDGSKIAKDVVAMVNREKVTLAEYEAYLDLFVLKEQRNRDRLRKALLGLINNRLLAREAERERIDRNEAIRGKIALAVGKVWYASYWKEVVKPTVRISDKEVLAEAPPFQDAVHLFQIVVSDPVKAASVRKRLVEKENTFENMARKESEGFSAAKGGDIGFVSRQSTQMYEEPVLDAIFRLKPGEISPVIPTKIGQSIFLVTELKPAFRSRTEWLEQNRLKFLEIKEKKVWDKHLLDLKKKHKIIVHDARGKELVNAMEKKEDLRKYAKTVLVEVDGKKWRAEDLIDPSGMGVVHGPQVLQTLLESRMREYLVSDEMEKKGIKSRYPALMRRERLLREDILAREMVRHSGRDIRVSDRDVEEYYHKNPEKFVSPRMLNVSVIEIGNRETLEKVYSDLNAGKSFEETADRYSRNKTLKGGSLGWVAENSITPQFASVRELKEGEFNRKALELKNPATKEKAYVVMKLNAIRPGGKIPLSEVNRRNVELAVMARKQEAVLLKLMERVGKTNEVVIESNVGDLIGKYEHKQKSGGDHGSSNR